jgi:hypothetical protein
VPHWARFEWALTYLVVSSQSQIRTLTVWRASRLRLHILNRKKRTLRHGHPVVPIFASRTCHQGARHDEQFDSRNVWGVMAKKVFRPCDGGVHVALTRPAWAKANWMPPQQGLSPEDDERRKTKGSLHGHDWRLLSQHMMWGSLGHPQSANTAALQNQKYRGRLWPSFRGRSSFTTAGSALRSTSESC